MSRIDSQLRRWADELEKETRKTVIKDTEVAIRGRVVPIVSEQMMVSIVKTVYGAYSPKVYKRRRGGGGLVDQRNFVPEIEVGEDGVSLLVRNETPANQAVSEDFGKTFVDGAEDVNLAQLVQYGDSRVGYSDYQYQFYDETNPQHKAFAKPRPFMKDTVQALQRSSAIEDAIATSLRIQGYEIIK